MNDVSESVLQESLDLLEQGLPIEQILARYPDHVAALRPFLQTALQLATVAPQPSLAAKQRSQKAFLAHAESLKVTPVQPSAWYRLRQILLPLVSLAAVVILFGATAVSVSGSAIPGDTLYTVKRLVEDVRLNGADDPETAVALVESYRQERIREVQTLLRTGRAAEASFEGEVQALQTDQWTVAEIDIQLNAATRITGQPRLGELARVNGRTENGVFTAETIEILTGSVAEPEQEPTPEPSPPAAPSATATATLTPTPAPTEALTATATATLTATPSPSPTATGTPTATPTEMPLPTATLVPTQPPPSNDNNNNNGGDNNNDNDDDGQNNNDDDDDDNDDSGNSNDSGGNDNDNDDDD
ncbi:MAG: DUF5667 domain-containing protein [Candidatus Promineifilaceae bacterium]